MEELVNLIMGSSTTLDAYVVVRLVVLMMALEMFAVSCGFLGSMKR